MATDKKISELVDYTPAVDTDVLPINDTTLGITKKITWANIKATLKNYFDTLYITVSQFVLTAGKVLTVQKTMTFDSADDTGVYTMPTGTATIPASTDIPVKATGAELTTGTDDTKFATAKAIKDSLNVPSVAPGTSGNVLTSDGTNWTSATPTGVADDVVKVVTVSLSSAEILALDNTVYKQLVPAPGAGKIIVLDQFIFSFTAGSTQYAAGTTSNVFYDGDSTFLIVNLNANDITSATDRINARTTPATDSIVITPGINKALVFRLVSSTKFTTGDGTAKMFVRYRILTL